MDKYAQDLAHVILTDSITSLSSCINSDLSPTAEREMLRKYEGEFMFFFTNSLYSYNKKMPSINQFSSFSKKIVIYPAMVWPLYA